MDTLTEIDRFKARTKNLTIANAIRHQKKKKFKCYGQGEFDPHSSLLTPFHIHVPSKYCIVPHIHIKEIIVGNVIVFAFI